MKKNNPIVSVIISTWNSEKFIENCLKTISSQSYKKIEIIVVDNFSKDRTLNIAKEFTKKIYSKGGERSLQRNFGAKKSKGVYLFFIDSDMELEQELIAECVDRMNDKNYDALIIPEESFGVSFWAKCKKLERSYYKNVYWIEAARFYSKKTFMDNNGFDEFMISGEDWDLSSRVAKNHKIGRTKYEIKHNEGNLSLLKTLQKKFYYGTKIRRYKNNADKEVSNKQSSLINRYKLFFSDKNKLFKDYKVGIGMLIMKTLEFVSLALGYCLSIVLQ